MMTMMTIMVLLFGVADAFIVGNRPGRSNVIHRRRRPCENKLMMTAAEEDSSSTTTLNNNDKKFKSICTFDETDFSGRTSWPYTSADLNRLDNSSDEKFYNDPRLVTHIDDNAIQSLQKFYQNEFETLAALALAAAAAAEKEGTIDVLDLCSSWISHFPLEDDESTSSFQYGKVVGLGMNQEELDANPQLTERGIVRNLNINPDMKDIFDDESFDVVTMTVSIDYLIKPLEVIQEIYRILKPGGSCVISFADRCFATKAVAMWLQADAIDKITMVASYFHYSQYNNNVNDDEGNDDDDDDTDNVPNFKWSSIEAFDLKEDDLVVPERPKFGDIISNPALGFSWMNTASAVQKVNNGDPLFVVKVTK